MTGVDVSKKFFDMVLRSEQEKRVIHVSVIIFWLKLLGTFFNPYFFPMTQKMLARVGPGGDPMATPSTCS